MDQQAVKSDQLSLIDIRSTAGLRGNLARNSRAQLVSPYAEPRGEPISFRLSRSLDLALRSAVGWKSKADNPKLKAAVENALLLWLAGDGSND